MTRVNILELKDLIPEEQVTEAVYMVADRVGPHFDPLTAGLKSGREEEIVDTVRELESDLSQLGFDEASIIRAIAGGCEEATISVKRIAAMERLRGIFRERQR